MSCQTGVMLDPCFDKSFRKPFRNKNGVSNTGLGGSGSNVDVTTSLFKNSNVKEPESLVSILVDGGFTNVKVEVTKNNGGTLPSLKYGKKPGNEVDR